MAEFAGGVGLARSGDRERQADRARDRPRRGVNHGHKRLEAKGAKICSTREFPDLSGREDACCELRIKLADALKGSVGEFYWAGTRFWVDPKEELIGVYMMQSVKHLLWYATMFKKLVVQAVVE